MRGFILPDLSRPGLDTQQNPYNDNADVFMEKRMYWRVRGEGVFFGQLRAAIGDCDVALYSH